jgi:Tol biopolymer transport system component
MLATAVVLAVMFMTGPVRAATGPNGLIAYSSWDADLNYDIYTVDPADPSATPVRLTTDGRYNSDPDWSPDGTRIVFDGWADTFGPRIQVMDADPATADWTVLSDPCPADPFDCYGDFQPVFSPDGTRIAFASARDGDGEYEIYVMDAAGEVGALPDAARLTNDPAAEFGQGISDSEVTWSPDGTRLAMLSNGRGVDADSCDLFVMDARDLDADGFGDNMTRLTFDDSYNCDPFEDVNPAWSPNSSLIAFTSVRSGYWDIWLVNADDPSDLRNVTQTPDGYEDQPSWSPDGSQVIFRSDKSGFYELYSLPVPPPSGGTIQRAAAPTPTQLTFNHSTKQQADWGSKPGSGGGSLMLTVQRNGTGRGRVTSTPTGINCGTDCSQAYPNGTQVTLTATASAGSALAAWSEPACGTAAACNVTMAAAKTVTATFNKAGTGGSNTLTVTKKGRGRVTSAPAGITCGTDCTESYASGTQVTLTAKPSRGQKLSAWSGACTGAALTCTVTMTAAKSVTATFARV